MKELYTGTLEVEKRRYAYNPGGSGRAWLTVPREAIEAAGLDPSRIRVVKTEDGTVAVARSGTGVPHIRETAD